MIQRYLVAVSYFVLSACATSGLQTRDVLERRPLIPAQKQINTVSFINQKDNFCGPATLTMAMNWAGHPADLESIASEIFIPSKNGSLPIDLVSAARRHGLLGIELEGLRNLLLEVSAGHPVIVLENLGFSWYPQWHYSLILGYDLDKQEIVMHSAHQAYQRLSLNYFERGWKLAKYWGIIILPPTQISPTADELNHLRGAVGIEQAGQLEAAKMAYSTILSRWPSSLGALIGLGNIYYAEGNSAKAVKYLSLAVQFHPNSLAAKNNLAIAKKKNAQ